MPLFSKSKHFVTLIELLIVIMVLALAAGAIGFSVHRAMREQRFKSEVELVVDYLRLAQNLMLIMNADVHIIFKADEKESFIHMKFKVDGDISDNLLKIVTEKERKLYAIQFLEFYDLNKTHNEPGTVDVKFISKGSVMSKGVMRMSTNESGDLEGAIERYICLPGYPKPIHSTDKAKDAECDDQKQTDFELRLASFTVQEISNKQTQNKKSE